MKQNIFLIGPASVGKSTVSKLLAERIGYRFIDIDLVFCDRIALIPDYINAHSYSAYCRRNSQLVDELIAEYPNKTVFATPSGFMVHEESPELVSKHSDLIRSDAISVLLLPSNEPHESADLIARRQKLRWPDRDQEKERERYISRHNKYKEYGDIQIIGKHTPDETVQLIVAQANDIIG